MNDFLKTIKGKNLTTLAKHNDNYPEWFVDTGNYVLNLQTSGRIYGGFRGRAIWQLAGEEATGKTRVWVQCMKTFLAEDPKRIGVIVSTENEQSIDDELLSLYGDRIVFITENDIFKVETELLNLFDRIEKQNPNDEDIRSFVVIDSWGFLVLKQAVDKAVAGKQVMMDLLGVKMKNEFAAKLTYRPLHGNSIVFITNHVYIPPDIYASAKTSGGKKLAYASQGIIILTKKKADKDDRSEMTLIKVETRKGRNPIKEGVTTIIPMEYHKGGLTRYGGLFDLCYSQIDAMVMPTSGWYAWADNPEIKFRKKQVEEDPEKFFTKERLEYIEVKARKVFCYSE